MGAGRKLLQSWEGRVIEVHDNEFTAIISDRTNPNNPDEEVVIDKEEVSPDDHELIFPGAVFYWSIGYKDGEPRRMVSQIRFCRLPALSRHELERATSEARQLAELFVDD